MKNDNTYTAQVQMASPKRDKYIQGGKNLQSIKAKSTSQHLCNWSSTQSIAYSWYAILMCKKL